MLRVRRFSGHVRHTVNMRRYINIFLTIQAVAFMVIGNHVSVSPDSFYLYFRFYALAIFTLAILGRVNVQRMDWKPKYVAEVFIAWSAINLFDEFLGNPTKFEPAEYFIGLCLPFYWIVRHVWQNRGEQYPKRNEE